MNKRYIIGFLSAAMLFSCSEKNLSIQEKPSDTIDSDELISVSASVASPQITRASSGIIYDYNSLLSTGDSLSLYAIAAFEDDNLVSILDNVPMWHNGASWTYTPAQHWLPSALKYDFFACYPYTQGRLDPAFKFPDSNEHYVLSLQPKVYPMYESWGGEDYAKGNIIRKMTKDLYLTNAIYDVMFGETSVSPSDYGKTVKVPLNHCASAVRFSVKNISESALTVTNWYMTGLKNHADMQIYIIGCDEQYEPMRYMVVLQDSEIDSLRVSNFAGDELDYLWLAGSNGVATICADGGVKPGQDGYYKYVLLSSPLKETGGSNLRHYHNFDGSIIYVANGDTLRSREELKNNAYYQSVLQGVKNTYSTTFPHYSKTIFWGPEHGLCTDSFFMTIAYKHGAQIIDFSRDQIRGNQADFDMKIHQFECISKVAKSGSTLKANGGIYMPVSGSNIAYLYSPYFLNAATFASVTGDWKEGMSPILSNNASVFRVTVDNSNIRKPVLVDSCIARMNRKAPEHTPSVDAGDLQHVLNDWGYLLLYPQTLENLVFNFHTSKATGTLKVSGISVDATYPDGYDNVLHSFCPKDYTPGGEWLSGYTYDYNIVISTSGVSVQVDVEPWNEREINLK